MSEEFADLIIRVIGDVIDVEDHNTLVRALNAIFTPVNVGNAPQPIQVSKPSILVLLVEGSSTIGFPNSVHVFLSEDDLIYEEFAGCDFPYDGLLHVATLTVPVPKDYYLKWIAPYGFVKSAVLF